MLSASYFWVGSEANIKGIYPNYYYKYNEKTPIEKRIQTVVDWLNLPEEIRPHFITFYLPEVDHAGHEKGPESKETEEAVHFIDSSIFKISEAVKSTGLPVNFVFVSDHGMLTVDTVNTLPLPTAIDTSKFIITRSRDIIVELYAKNKADIEPSFKKIKNQENGFIAYLKTNVPSHLHYSAKDDSLNRIGDILLVANAPKIFNYSNFKRKQNPGRHGYDPTEVKEMHAVFYAWGPAFKKGLTIPPFNNVDVYPLIAELLGLKYDFKIDGNDHLIKEILLDK
jgi:predicted AlkP superfamily pyrophosphatase or phosphodiesterase